MYTPVADATANVSVCGCQETCDAFWSTRMSACPVPRAIKTGLMGVPAPAAASASSCSDDERIEPNSDLGFAFGFQLVLLLVAEAEEEEEAEAATAAAEAPRVVCRG